MTGMAVLMMVVSKVSINMPMDIVVATIDLSEDFSIRIENLFGKNEGGTIE
jgi:hypothetical protein